MRSFRPSTHSNDPEPPEMTRSRSRRSHNRTMVQLLRCDLFPTAVSHKFQRELGFETGNWSAVPVAPPRLLSHLDYQRILYADLGRQNVIAAIRSADQRHGRHFFTAVVALTARSRSLVASFWSISGRTHRDTASSYEHQRYSPATSGCVSARVRRLCRRHQDPPTFLRYQ